jgi:hypothetical protein
MINDQVMMGAPYLALHSLGGRVTYWIHLVDIQVPYSVTKKSIVHNQLSIVYLDILISKLHSTSFLSIKFDVVPHLGWASYPTSSTHLIWNGLFCAR